MYAGELTYTMHLCVPVPMLYSMNYFEWKISDV